MSVKREQRRLIRENVDELSPYKPVEAPEELAARLGMPLDRILKLDANENPYGCSVLVQDALSSFDRYHQYADAQARHVRERLAIYAGCSADRIVVGSGSDELIDLILLTLIDPGDEAIIPTPTFGVYRARTELLGGRVIEVPRTEETFDLDVDGIIDQITERTKAVFVTSPNNPTGNIASNQEIVRLLETGVLVILDEAYYEFAGKTSLPLIREFDNLVILRTFSKWAGIAGLRFGYAILPDFLIEPVWKVKPPFNVSTAALVAVDASLDDIEYLHLTINRLRNEQRRLFRRLMALDFLEPYPSVANYILCKVTHGDAHDVHQQLADRGIMVRGYGDPQLRDYLRISVGKPEDTDRLVAALQKIGSRV